MDGLTYDRRLNYRRCSVIRTHFDYMTLLSGSSLWPPLHFTSEARLRLAMENEWLLEEGWGLFLVLVSTFRVYNLSSSESKGRII